MKIKMKIKRLLIKFSDAYWWFIHRIHPNHRYHVIKTDLKPGYYDPEDRITHAIFTVVCEYYLDGAPWFDWSCDDYHNRAFDDLKEAYIYWKIDRPIMEEDKKDSDDVLAIQDKIIKNDRMHMTNIIKNLGYYWYA